MSRARVFFMIWGVLIIAGIISKRMFSHPDLMVFFHLPAAVFLVLGWYESSRGFRARQQAVFLQRRLARQKAAPPVHSKS